MANSQLVPQRPGRPGPATLSLQDVGPSHSPWSGMEQQVGGRCIRPSSFPCTRRRPAPAGDWVFSPVTWGLGLAEEGDSPGTGGWRASGRRGWYVCRKASGGAGTRGWLRQEPGKCHSEAWAGPGAEGTLGPRREAPQSWPHVALYFKQEEPGSFHLKDKDGFSARKHQQSAPRVLK